MKLVIICKWFAPHMSQYWTRKLLMVWKKERCNQHIQNFQQCFMTWGVNVWTWSGLLAVVTSLIVSVFFFLNHVIGILSVSDTERSRQISTVSNSPRQSEYPVLSLSHEPALTRLFFFRSFPLAPVLIQTFVLQTDREIHQILPSFLQACVTELPQAGLDLVAFGC